MKKIVVFFLLSIVFIIAIWGVNPFSHYRETSGLFNPAYNNLETGITTQPNGVIVVKALTRMPKVKAKMVRWWFADYMQTTAHYQKWHPKAHVWMSWENKREGEIIGASHLVHEYIGNELQKLRIQFVDPVEFFPDYTPSKSETLLCARAGELKGDLNLTTMCHYIRDTEFGAEMRSIFWLGHVAKREGNQQVRSIEGLLGNTALARYFLLNTSLANDLMTHAIEEMGNLADFLPQLYEDNLPTK
ncbi:DAPG hydrolase family protein [Alteromonas sp. HB246098]